MQIYAEAESRAKIFASPIWRYKKRSDRCERSVRRKLVCSRAGLECRKAIDCTAILHLNPAKMLIQACNMLKTNMLQDFRQQHPRFRCSVGVKCRKMQIRLAGISGKGFTERQRNPPMHLNPNQNCKNRCNLLKYFYLQGFTKKPSAFRCSERQEHLNPAKTQIQIHNQLTTNVLQDFQQQYQRFRYSVGVKCRKMQIRLAGISGKGFTERQRKPPHASEPEPKPQTPPQLTE